MQNCEPRTPDRSAGKWRAPSLTVGCRGQRGDRDAPGDGMDQATSTTQTTGSHAVSQSFYQSFCCSSISHRRRSVLIVYINGKWHHQNSQNSVHGVGMLFLHCMSECLMPDDAYCLLVSDWRILNVQDCNETSMVHNQLGIFFFFS
jgi:hypothetical protein